VVCEIETPLSINPTVFQGVNQGACSLTVPAGSIAAYKLVTVTFGQITVKHILRVVFTLALRQIV